MNPPPAPLPRRGPDYHAAAEGAAHLSRTGLRIEDGSSACTRETRVDDSTPWGYTACSGRGAMTTEPRWPFRSRVAACGIAVFLLSACGDDWRELAPRAAEWAEEALASASLLALVHGGDSGGPSAESRAEHASQDVAA